MAVNAFTLNWAQIQCPYMFSPFIMIGRTLTKIVQDMVKFALIIVPLWPSAVVANPAGSSSSDVSPATGYLEESSGRVSSTSCQQQAKAVCMHTLGSSEKFQSLPERAFEIILSSWKPSTQKSYSTAWNSWLCWCAEGSVNPHQPLLSDILVFLSKTFDKGKSTSWINTHRSALIAMLGTIDGFDIGKHPIICRLLKGMSNISPKAPKYTFTWDVSVLLSHIKKMDHQILKDITLKTVGLLALATACRCSELTAFDIRYITKYAEYMIAHISHSKILKGGKMKEIIINNYHQDPNICPKLAIQEYLYRTEHIRALDSYQLFISFRKPFGPVSPSTIGRWLKTLMNHAGIDTHPTLTLTQLALLALQHP